MPPDDALNQLQALDAIACENDMVLAFRAAETSEDLEPVFFTIHRANTGGSEATLIAITDENGLPLGRYVVSRSRLDGALQRAAEIEDTETESAVVPLEWETG